ncbi:CAP domain-containing protein [Stomatobaculum longum]|uniref:CAP domain-containing protein n=1 Tax=Stomatobaculum longum TaxID=796942 RepID=UPI0028EADE69|nr:CAP domain-containing protein [Stomatobaculum longum]
MKVWRRFVCVLSVAAVSAALAVPAFADGAQWKRNDRGWWYEEANGAYPTDAWRLINGKWYYFDAIGYMAESRWIGNYYVGADGAMLAGTWTPDGYYVDASGKWVEGLRHPVPVVEAEPVRRVGSGGNRSTGRSGGGGGRRRGGSGGGSGSGFGGGSTTGTTVTASTQGQESGNASNTTVNANTGAQNVANTAAAAAQTESEETRVIAALRAQGLTEKEAKLYYDINAYRESLGLQKLSFSKSLTTVARTHVVDANAYNPKDQVDARGVQGNLHSWSSHGNWTPVVYTGDHLYASAMWSKPRELTSYQGNGFENSAWSSGLLTPEVALDLWQHSEGHNAVMTTQGAWSDLKTMGVGIDGNYAFVWFGKDADPAGYYDVPDYQVLRP